MCDSHNNLFFDKLPFYFIFLPLNTAGLASCPRLRATDPGALSLFQVLVFVVAIINIPDSRRYVVVNGKRGFMALSARYRSIFLLYTFPLPPVVSLHQACSSVY